MLTLILIGTAAAIVVILFASMLTRNATRRDRRFAADSGDTGYVPWMHGGGGSDGGSGDCSSSDAGSSGCDGGGGDGGGGGGGD